MKNQALLLVIISLLLVSGFTGCSKNKSLHKKAQNFFERGNYDSATFLAVESLLLKPEYDKAVYTLGQAYPKAKQEHLEQISALQDLDSEDKWKGLLGEYLALDKLQQAVKKLPAIFDPNTGFRLNFDSTDYSAEIKQARSNAAENYYQKGLHQSMIDSSRSSQKKAAGFFTAALDLMPNYKDSADRYETARQNAITRIAITSFENKSGVGNRYGAIDDILSDLVMSYIMLNHRIGEFVEIISRAQMEQVFREQELGASGFVDENSAAKIGVLLGAQEILSGRILQVDYMRERVTYIDERETATVLIEGEDPDSSEDMEINCLFRKYTKTASLRILASYSVVDVSTGKIKTQKSLNASRYFEDEWGKVISGDERALTTKQKNLVKTREPSAPSAKEMVYAALDELSRDISAHFFSYIQ